MSTSSEDSSWGATGWRATGWPPVRTGSHSRGHRSSNRGHKGRRGRGGAVHLNPGRFGLIQAGQLRYRPYKSRSGVSDKPPTSAAYTRTLGFVTTAKLDELEKQQEVYSQFSGVLEDSRETSLDATEGHVLIERLGVLYNSVVDHLTPDDSRIINGHINIDDLGVWLSRAKADPSFDKNIVREWTDSLEAHIKQGKRKLEFARLCGKLYTDWLDSGDALTVRSDNALLLSQQAAKEESKQEGRREMHEQVARLRSIILQPLVVDVDALEAYLTSVFSSKSAQAVLEEMRTGMATFGHHLRNRTITPNDMRWTVESLLASDLMQTDKRAALREFTDNETVLEEVTNVINMRLRALGSWKWPDEAISVDMRRYLHGKYRAYTDPDILDALFLQWVGIMWGIKFKSDARSIFHSDAWKVALPGDTSTYIPSDLVSYSTYDNTTISGERKHHRHTHFLCGHLPDNVSPKAYYDEPADTAGDDPGDAGDATVEVKQQLLNILSTECYHNVSLHGSHTIVRTDAEWFGPSLPHESIITILRFFGVPSDWLEFFRTFLHMPIRFPGEAQASMRVRGTPIAYPLSGFFGEVVLFGMDFAVNQRTRGLFLYRMHDDIWFWDSNPQRCALAWQEMNEYAKLVGLTFNASKTGSACIGDNLSPDLQLPSGDIRWGFLKFDSTEMRFVIDQSQVDEHIQDLRRQLENTKSVLGWISVYNRYMAFFVRNFGGRPAECFGRQHVVDVSKTLVRIQREIIDIESSGSATGGVIEYLEKELATRYGVQDLPKGYFYFPLSAGGLALRDPLIDILVMGETMTGDAVASIENALAEELEVYEVAKREWEAEQRRENAGDDSKPPPVFYPFTSYCEMQSSNIHQLYTSLVSVNKPRPVTMTPLIKSALSTRGKDEVVGPGRESYKGWIYEAYGRDVVRRFGGLEIVDPRMIPIGLVHLYKTSRIRWDQ